MEKTEGAAHARIEKIRGLSLIRDEAAPARSARPSPLAVVLLCVVAAQAFALGYFVFVHGAAGGAAGAMPAAAAPPAARDAAAAAGESAVRLQAQGFVVATRQATVSTRVAGIVTRVPVKVGDHVERGQVVGMLNADLAAQDLDLAEKELLSLRAAIVRDQARQDQAESEYQRELQLEKSNYTSRARLDEKKAASAVARATVASSQAGLEVGALRARQQRSLLDNYTIHAPFAGIVVETNSQVGELVAPMSAGGSFTRTGICTIVDMASLILVVDVGEQQISHVQVGRPVTFRLYLDDKTEMRGVVQRIVPSADRAKGTLQVQIAMDGTDARALPGMRANVNFN